MVNPTDPLIKKLADWTTTFERKTSTSCLFGWPAILPPPDGFELGESRLNQFIITKYFWNRNQNIPIDGCDWLALGHWQNPSGNVLGAKAESKFQIFVKVGDQLRAIDGDHKFEWLSVAPNFVQFHWMRFVQNLFHISWKQFKLIIYFKII